jgi:hypothetical protein
VIHSNRRTSDVDAGANDRQNLPLLTSVVSNGGITTIQGNLNSKPNTTYRINFYSNAAVDPSGNGKGALFFNTASVSSDGSGNATINATFPDSLPSGRVITATATDPVGNTSQFSATDSSAAYGSLQFSVSSLKESGTQIFVFAFGSCLP